MRNFALASLLVAASLTISASLEAQCFRFLRSGGGACCPQPRTCCPQPRRCCPQPRTCCPQPQACCPQPQACCPQPQACCPQPQACCPQPQACCPQNKSLDECLGGCVNCTGRERVICEQWCYHWYDGGGEPPQPYPDCGARNPVCCPVPCGAVGASRGCFPRRCRPRRCRLFRCR
jgi:hypothetical protein